jgi:hypothetical protein
MRGAETLAPRVLTQVCAKPRGTDMKLAATIFSGLALSCAAPPIVSRPSTEGGRAWSGSGILMISQEEMHLFRSRGDVGIFPGRCTTVAVRNRKDFDNYRRLNGLQVSIKGEVIVWPSDAISLRVGDRNVRNLCNSDVIVIASHISR